MSTFGANVCRQVQPYAGRTTNTVARQNVSMTFMRPSTRNSQQIYVIFQSFILENVRLAV